MESLSRPALQRERDASDVPSEDAGPWAKAVGGQGSVGPIIPTFQFPRALEGIQNTFCTLPDEAVLTA